MISTSLLAKLLEVFCLELGDLFRSSTHGGLEGGECILSVLSFERVRKNNAGDACMEGWEIYDTWRSSQSRVPMRDASTAKSFMLRVGNLDRTLCLRKLV